MEKTFVEAVKAYFGFLIRDYGFEILSAVESPHAYFWEGEVVYATKTTYVYIECTRGETPSFYIGRVKDIGIVANDRRKHLLPFHLIYEYMVTTDNEKRIITSLTEQKQAKKIIYQKKYISREIPVDDLEKKQELELETYAKLMQRYAASFLLGDFSKWPEIWEYSIKKGIAEWIQPSRSEISRFTAIDKNGKQKIYGQQQYVENPLEYIQQLEKSLYGRNLDYIKQLKTELK